MKNIVNPIPEIFVDAIPQPVLRDLTEQETVDLNRYFTGDRTAKYVPAIKINNVNKIITGWSITPGPGQVLRNGSGYDYEDERNKFIIDMIHTAYLGGYGHLNIGQEIAKAIRNGSYGLNDENRFLLLKDAMAYAALYPQNAAVALSPTAPPNPQNPRLNGKSFALIFVGEEEKQKVLTRITTVLGQRNATKNSAFDTVTTEQAQKASNQNDVNNPDPFTQPKKATYTVKSNGETFSTIANKFKIGRLELQRVNQNKKRPPPNQNQNILDVDLSPGDIVDLPFNSINARVPSIIPSHSRLRINELLEAATRPTGSIPSGLTVIKKDLSEEKKKVDSQVDSSDWTANVPSDTSPEQSQTDVSSDVAVNITSYKSKNLLKKVYYNQAEKNYWCVFRTLAKNPKSFDIAGGEAAIQNINNFKFDFAVPEILKFASRDTTQNRAAIDPSKVEFLSRYGSLNRPQPVPAGQSFWIIAVKIPESEIEKLNPRGAKSSTDDIPSPLQRAKDLVAEKGVQGKPGLRRAPFSMSELQSTIATAAIVVDRYADELDKEGITPGMMTPSTSVRIRAEDLKRFYSVVQRYAERTLDTDITINDKIEFVFDSKYKLVNVFYNGAQYAGLADPKTGLYTAFGAVSKATFALVFYANEIAALFTKEDKPSAVEFVQKYMYPSPVIKPTDIKNKKEENKKSNKNPPENQSAGLGKNTFETKPEKKKKTSKPKTKAEVERQFQRRFQAGADALGFYTSVLNNAGCETPLAKYLNDAFLIYQLFGGKASVQQVVGVVVKLLRDEFIEIKKNEQLLLQGAAYLDDPDQFVRDIEAEVNRQFFDCFRVLGDILAKEVLEPGGVPPEVQSLVKAGLEPIPGILIAKTPTGDLWALWRKKLLELIIEFIKQLILQAFKELLLAVSGCGPETVVDPSNITKNRNPNVNSPYGIIRINDLVDYAGVDLIEVAKELSMRNVLPNEDRTDIIETPATLEQLRRLNDDASDLMVDNDVVAILQGSGGQALIDSLFRGFNLGSINLNELSAADQGKIQGEEYNDRVSRALLNTVQESLYPGDVRYATLDLDKELIVLYFKRLGQLVGSDIALGLEKPLDTKEAYCDSRDLLAYGLGSGLEVGLEELADIGDSGVVAGGLSKAQLASQIGQQIDRNAFKIELLCELASKNFDFALEIQQFWDTLGFAEWFMEFLRLLSLASQQAQGVGAKAIADGMRARGDRFIEQQSTELSPAELSELKTKSSQIYRYYQHYFGDIDTEADEISGNPQLNSRQILPPETLKFVYEPVAGLGDDRPHYVIGSLDTSIGKEATPRNDRSFGRLQLDYLNDDGLVRVYFNDNERAIIEDELGYRETPFELLCEFGLVDDNTPDGEGEFSVRRAIVRSRQPIIRQGRPDDFAKIINDFHKKVMNVSFGSQLNLDGTTSFGGGENTETVRNAVAENVFVGTGVDGTALIQVATPYLNSLYNVTQMVSTNLYSNDQFKSRVDETVILASKLPFGPNGDPCNLGADEQNAIITINAIHQRIFNFILNVAPLFNNGYGLETPDTLNMLSSYLENKIIRDFEQRKILGFVIEGVSFISRTCSTTEIEDGIEFNPALISDPQEKLRYIIKQMLKKTLFNLSTLGAPDISEFSGWRAMTRNMFDDINGVDGGEIKNQQGTVVLNKKTTYKMLANLLYTGRGYGPLGDLDAQGLSLGAQNNATRNYDFGGDVAYLGQARQSLANYGFVATVDGFKENQFLGLIPMPLLVGLQYIYFDKVVAINDQFPQMAYYAKKRIDSADEALRTAIDPASSQSYSFALSTPQQPKTLDESKQDDADLEADLLGALRQEQETAQILRDVADAAVQGQTPGAPGQNDQGEELARRLQDAPPGNAQQPAGQSTRDMQQEQEAEGISQSERERRAAERREQIRREGTQGQQRQPTPPVQQQQQNDGSFPAQVGPFTYANADEVRARKAKYDALLVRVNRIRDYKTALQTRLRQCAGHLQSAEKTWTDDGVFRGYDDLTPSGRNNWTMRKSLNVILNKINEASSLDITYFGRDGAGGGGGHRAYNPNRDCLVRGRDIIRQTDFDTSAALHPRPPFTRKQAFVARPGLEDYKNLMDDGFRGGDAGMLDRFEKTEFYTQLINAMEDFQGFSVRPPARRISSINDYEPLNRDLQASRGNNVISILAMITKEIADLDESNLITDLRLEKWGAEERNEVGRIIRELRRLL